MEDSNNDALTGKDMLENIFVVKQLREQMNVLQEDLDTVKESINQLSLMVLMIASVPELKDALDNAFTKLNNEFAETMAETNG